MAYNSQKGTQHSGDIQYEGDPDDTQIDFENNLVAIKTDGIQRLIVSSSAVTSSVVFSGSYDVYGHTFRGTSVSASTGITGSSLRVGAYGLTNDGKFAISSLTLGGTAITSNAGELNLVDGASAGTVVNNKAVVYSGTGQVNAIHLSAASGITGSSLRVGAYGLTNDGKFAISSLTLGGTAVTSNAGELNLLDGSSAGTVVNSKAVIYSAAGVVQGTDFKGPDGFEIGNATNADLLTLAAAEVTVKANSDFTVAKTAGLKLADGVVTSTAAELNLLDTAAVGTVANSKAVIYSAAGQVNATHLSSSTGITGSSLLIGAGGLTNAGALSLSSINTNWTNVGRTIADLGIVTTADINGGTLDNVVIGAAAATSATVTSLNAGASTFQIEANPVAQFIHPGDNSTGAVINLINSKAGNAGDADDFCGGVVFKSRDSTSVATQYSKISTKIGDPTNTSEDGYMLFEVTTAGAAATTYLRLDGLQSAITASQHMLVNADLSTTGMMHMSGAVRHALALKTANYSISLADSIVTFNASSACTGTLPTIAAGQDGIVYTIKNIGSGQVRVIGSPSPEQNIDGQSTGLALDQGDCLQVYSFTVGSGYDWAVLNFYNAS